MPHANPSQTLPRILCLHGGGTSAEIFAIQLRTLRRTLGSHFRFVFADAPFLCNPGPGALPIFADMGPYRRWLRWIEAEHAPVDDETALGEIEYALRNAMEADDAEGATGEWVGLLGFSQGAKVVASVLYESELRMRKESAAGMLSAGQMPVGVGGGRWRFAVVMNGRPPLVKMSGLSAASRTMAGAGEATQGCEQYDYKNGADRLWLPTLHVHGLEDPGLELHRQLSDYYCVHGSAEVVEWHGGHRVPVKSDDAQRVTAAILRVAKRAGALPGSATLDA